MVVIDYLQLMYYDGRVDNRNQELTKITGMLKAMSKELEIPVMALSQLNRGLESRPLTQRRPQMADLRESGAIEQDADNVFALYRDFVYNPKGQDDDDFAQESNENNAEINILKQRNGPLGKVDMVWFPKYTKFANLDKRKEPNDVF